MPTCLHAQPSRHDLRNRRSRHLLGPRPPPTERSSPRISLYGGKTSIEEITRLHTPEKVSETMFTRSSAVASFEAHNGASQLRFKKLAPRPDSSEDDLPFGCGNASIGGRTRLHALVRLRQLPSHASTHPARVHTCLAHACMRPAHAGTTCLSTDLPHQHLSPVSMPFGKKKKKINKKIFW